MKSEEVELYKVGNVECWFIKGTTILHREDGPAYIDEHGVPHWFKHGKPQRTFRLGDRLPSNQ